MRLPNSHRAIIDPLKLHGYLLSHSHPLGRFKARFFSALGFAAEQWGILEQALRTQHLPHDSTPGPVEAHGQSHTIRAMLTGPAGGAPVVSVWFIRTGEDVPRFVTAFPGGDQ